jgi:hypothetical protein
MDNTNGKIWISSLNGNQIKYFTTSSHGFTSISLPSGASQPYYVVVDPADSRVDVTFQSPGNTGVYFFSSPAQWICSPATGSQAYGVAYLAPYSWWSTAYGSNQYFEGLC